MNLGVAFGRAFRFYLLFLTSQKDAAAIPNAGRRFQFR